VINTLTGIKKIDWSDKMDGNAWARHKIYIPFLEIAYTYGYLRPLMSKVPNRPPTLVQSVRRALCVGGPAFRFLGHPRPNIVERA
jgi:hypothetical protein